MFLPISGEIDDYQHISYTGYAPNRLINRYIQVLRSMMENGINKFYLSYAKHLEEIRSKQTKIGHEFRPLRLGQLTLFLWIYVVQITFSIIVFIIELIVHCVRRRYCVQQNDSGIP